MKNTIHIGIDRGFGLARSLFQSRQKKDKSEFNYLFPKHKRLSKKFPNSSPEEWICKFLLEAHEFGGIRKK